MNRLVIYTLLIAVTASAAACTRKPPVRQVWQNPNLPEAQWSEDQGECRRYARREVEREARLDMGIGGANDSSLAGGSGTYNTSLNRYELRRFQERMFSDCMRRLGYAPLR